MSPVEPGPEASIGTTGSPAERLAIAPLTGSPIDMPPGLRTYFGPDPAALERYAGWLAEDAVRRGLVGPGEADRLWERHLLNCALIADLIPPSVRVVDVGSGAGLPGVVLACVRPDLTMQLVDPLHRRTSFLSAVVDGLDLGNRVEVVTGRVQDADVRARLDGASWVTARAVAPLGRLATWCVPLLAAGGTLVAIKGERAAEEIERDAAAVRRAGGGDAVVHEWDVDGLGTVARAVVLSRDHAPSPTTLSTDHRRTARRKRHGDV